MSLSHEIQPERDTLVALRWYSTVVGSRDHRALARWWAGVLGWDLVVETNDEVVLVPP